MNSPAANLLIALLALLSLAATWRVTPETIDRLREEPPAPGDTVLFADGRYEGLWRVSSQNVTYRAEGDGALFEAIYLQPEARDNLFDRLRQSGSTLHFGIAIQGHGNVFRGVTVRDNATHGFLFRCMSNDSPCSDPPIGNLLDGVESSGNGNTGIKLDAGIGSEIRGCLVHHNGGQGLLEGASNVEVVIANCEFAYNGSDGYDHGLYLKGRSGSVFRNRVHHNAGYGIHCWAACYGTADKQYSIMWNDIFANGSGGTVIAGSAKEAKAPGDGYARFVRYQHNRERDNGDWPPDDPLPESAEQSGDEPGQERN